MQPIRHAPTLCDECGSPFNPTPQGMDALCSECAYWLYRKPHCAHRFTDRFCSNCGWNGSCSKYIVQTIRTEWPEILETILFPIINGFFGGTVARILVNSGDCVHADDEILIVEDSTAFINLPAIIAGTVVRSYKSVGDSVSWEEPIVDVIPLCYQQDGPG